MSIILLNKYNSRNQALILRLKKSRNAGMSLPRLINYNMYSGKG